MTSPGSATHPHGEATPAPLGNRPGLASVVYRVGDHARFRRAMLEALSRTSVDGGRPLAGLTARDTTDPVPALIDAWATSLDVVTFYQERIANSVFLGTADREDALHRITALVGHRPAPGRSASTRIAFTVEGEVPVNLPAGLRIQSVPDPGGKAVVFETWDPLLGEPGLNRLRPRTGRDAPATLSATQAWLAGTKTGLAPGDTILLVSDARRQDPSNGPWALATVTQVTERRPERKGGAAPGGKPEGTKGRGSTFIRWTWRRKEGDGDDPLRIHPLALTARGFGHNAPDWKELKQAYDAAKALVTQSPFPPEFVTKVHEWDTIHFFHRLPENGVPFKKDATTEGPLDLDSTYPIGPGSWAVLHETGKSLLLRVDGATVVGRSGYRLSASVTRLQTTPSKPSEAEKYPVSSSSLLSFGPELPQSEAPAHPLWNGTARIDLDTFYPALEAGRTLVLEGERVALPSIKEVGTPRGLRCIGPGSDVLALKAPGNAKTGPEPGDIVMGGHAPEGILPGTPLTADHVTLVTSFVAGETEIVFDDGSGDGYGPGDAVYAAFLPPQNPAVALGLPPILRLTAAGSYMPGTVVRTGDADTTSWPSERLSILSPEGPPTVVRLAAGPDHPSLDGALYLTPGPVEVGAPLPIGSIRIGPGTFGSQVLDDDVERRRSGVVGDARAVGAEPVQVGRVETVETAAGARTRIELRGVLAHAYDPATVVLHGNVAAATHGETQRLEVLGDGQAAASHQVFQVTKTPITFVADPRGEKGVRPELLVRVAGIEWERRTSLHGAGPDDAAYVLERTPDGTRVRFGDGVKGARLPTGTGNVSALYRKGTGWEGNARAGQVRNPKDKPKGLKAATNPLPAEGGIDEEPLDVTRRAAPESVLTLDRVVSLRDFEDAARSYVGVAKARAAPAWLGGRQVVQLTIVGEGNERIGDGHPLRKDLVDYLDARRDPHQALSLRVHDPVPIALTVHVEPDPRHDPDAVRRAVRETLLASFHLDRRSLGEAVHHSALTRMLHDLAGVAGVHMTRLGRRPAAEGAAPHRLRMEPHEIPTLAADDLRVLLPGDAP